MIEQNSITKKLETKTDNIQREIDGATKLFNKAIAKHKEFPYEIKEKFVRGSMKIEKGNDMISQAIIELENYLEEQC